MLHDPPGSLRGRPYRAVFFDAGNTLFGPHPSLGERYAETARAFGLEVAAAAVESSFRAAWARQGRPSAAVAEASEAAEKAWWRGLVREVFRDLGPLADFDGFFERLYDLFAEPDTWRLFPDAVPALEACRRAGSVVGVVSNWDARLLRICRGLDLERRLDFICYSAGVGAAKPDPRIFAAALAKAGVPRERVLHVGDSHADDVAGARAAGLDALWLRREMGGPEPDTAAADSLAEVPDLCREVEHAGRE